MHLFHIIDDAVCILRSKGVYKQVKVYHRAGKLYAAHGAGFISLRAQKNTSLPNVLWDDLEVPGGYKQPDNISPLVWLGYKP